MAIFANGMIIVSRREAEEMVRIGLSDLFPPGLRLLVHDALPARPTPRWRQALVKLTMIWKRAWTATASPL
jgi:hypothetical protein